MHIPYYKLTDEVINSGFSEIDDQIQSLSHTIKEIHLEAKAEKQDIQRALEIINKKIDRTIHNQEIQPNISLNINTLVYQIMKHLEKKCTEISIQRQMM